MDIFPPFLVLVCLLIAAFTLLYDGPAPVPARAVKKNAHARKAKTSSRKRRH